MAKELKIVYKPLDSIYYYENNPRRNEKAVKSVRNSIKEFGFLNPIILDKDNVIICGHTRFLAAQQLGIKNVPTIIADDLTEEQVTAFRLVDNKVAEIAVWDKDKLHQELMELKDIFNMADFGFKSEKENIEKELRKTHKCPKCGYEW